MSEAEEAYVRYERIADDQILDLWAAGELSRLQIADQLGIEPKRVHLAIMRGRRQSPPDPRAVKRDRIERVKASNERRYDTLRPGGGPNLRQRRIVKKFGRASTAELLALARAYAGPVTQCPPPSEEQIDSLRSKWERGLFWK